MLKKVIIVAILHTAADKALIHSIGREGKETLMETIQNAGNVDGDDTERLPSRKLI